jgi:hypothetical protein
MKNNSFIAKHSAVLTSAVIGAVLINLIILLCRYTHAHSSPGYFWYDMCGITAFWISIPVVFIIAVTGLDKAGGPALGFGIYSFLGAVSFALLTIVWQFVSGFSRNKQISKPFAFRRTQLEIWAKKCRWRGIRTAYFQTNATENDLFSHRRLRRCRIEL